MLSARCPSSPNSLVETRPNCKTRSIIVRLGLCKTVVGNAIRKFIFAMCRIACRHLCAEVRAAAAARPAAPRRRSPGRRRSRRRRSQAMMLRMLRPCPMRRRRLPSLASGRTGASAAVAKSAGDRHRAEGGRKFDCRALSCKATQ